jgi:hypothetical protein
LHTLLDVYDKKYSLKTVGDPGDRLEMLIREISEQTGTKVVILVDEYDAPILGVLHKSDVLQEIREVMRNFYSPLKKSNEYLRFVFITGISTFSQMGVFSELNNLEVITNNDDYASICGITQQELLDNFSVGIDAMAKAKHLTREDVLSCLQSKYDGYHFTDEMVDIYNPYSLLNAFKTNKLGDYWFSSGTSAYLLELLKNYRKRNPSFKIDDLENSGWMSYSTFNKSLELNSGYIPLFYQAGYLTIKEYDAKYSRYRLGIPNDEVRVGLLGDLLPLYTDMDTAYAKDTVEQASIYLQEGKIEQAMLVFKSLLASVPFLRGSKQMLKDVQKTEAFYHSLFYIFFYMLHNGTEPEVRNATGSADVVIKTDKYIYIIEIKINSSPEVALKQIEEKGYALPYLADKRQVIKVGANFSTQLRTLDSWKVEVENGAKVNE